jgi:hypothetical protein
MKRCKYSGWVDGYLMGKLGENEAREFEEHYFNCPSCFRELGERDEIVGVLKRNPSVFAAEEKAAGETRKTAWAQKVLDFLSPRQWATVGAAAVLLVAVVALFPLLHRSSPRFALTGGDTVRGAKLTLISPVIDVKSVPAEFEWMKLGQDAEYQISIFNGDLLWKTSTKENRVTLPADIRSRMTPGSSYSWQVKAFSKEGTLIAVSSRVRFSIAE